MSGNNDLDVVDFTCLAETDDPAKAAAKALARRNQMTAAAAKSAAAAMKSNASAAEKSAKLAVANAKKNLANQVYNAAITEDETAERLGLVVVIPPRGGTVESFNAAGQLVARSCRVGNRIDHHNAAGQIIATTTLSGKKLFSRAADGKLTGSHIIRN